MSQEVSEIQLTMAANYTTVAFVVVLLYDYVLTFGMEVEFIWKQKMNSGKILFLLNRYVPIVDLTILMNTYTNPAIHSIKFCAIWFKVDKWTGIFSIAVIDAILLLRTWALWRLSRVILISLSALLVVCIVLSSWSIRQNPIPIHSPNNIRPCASTQKGTKVFYTIWITFIVFDFIVLALTLIRTVPSLYSNTSPPLMKQLLKDGVLYFFIIFLMSIANIIVITVGPPPLVSMLIAAYRAMTATLGSRLILNLRGSVLRPAYNEDHAALEMNLLSFNGEAGDQTTLATYSMQDIEDPEGAARRRESRLRVQEQTARLVGQSLS